MVLGFLRRFFGSQPHYPGDSPRFFRWLQDSQGFLRILAAARPKSIFKSRKERKKRKKEKKERKKDKKRRRCQPPRGRQSTHLTSLKLIIRTRFQPKALVGRMMALTSAPATGSGEAALTRSVDQERRPGASPASSANGSGHDKPEGMEPERLIARVDSPPHLLYLH